MKLFIQDSQNNSRRILGELDHRNKAVQDRLGLICDLLASVELITIDSLELPLLIDELQKRVDAIVKANPLPNEMDLIKTPLKVTIDPKPKFTENQVRIFVDGTFLGLYLTEIKSENWKEVVK